MDAVDQTAISKEDALPKVDGLTKECDDGGLKSAQSTCDLKSDTVEANIGTVDGKRDGVAAVDNIENSDDFLEKIKEVVKEDEESNNGNSAGVNDVAQGSEQDFLKRLDEFEQETKNEELAESKKNEEALAASVEECVTSSDEKETAGNMAAPDESDETVRTVSDNIVDSTSQELGKKVAEKPIQEAKKPESSEEITEIVSSEDDESSAVEKQTEKAVAQSVVEISSDEGSDDVAVVEKSMPENSAISSACETTVDKDTSIEPPLKNGEVQQSSLEVDTTETAVEVEEKSEPKEPVADEPKALLLLEELASNKIENGKEVTEETKLTTEEPKETSAVSAEASAEKETVEATSGNVETETLPMSVDQSPENVDTMEIDEEENMDVDMTENVSENDEEMATVEEEKTVAVEVVPTPEKTLIAEKSDEPKIIDETESVAANEETVVAATSTGSNEDTEESTETFAARLHEMDAEKSKKAEKVPREKEEKAVEILSAAVPIVSEKEPTTVETPKEVFPSKSNVVVEQKSPTKIEKAESPKKTAVSKVEPEKVIAKPAVESVTPKVTVVEAETIDKRKADNKPDVIVKIADESNSLKNDQGESETNTDKFRSARVENKLLKNTMKHGGSIASLDGSPTGAASNANVFNSTPIQQQFEISSENVSKISEVNEQANRTSESALSKTEETTSTEMGTTTTSESDHQTSDSVTKYLKLVKQCNGIAPEERNIPAKSTSKTTPQSNFNILQADLVLSNTDTDSTSKKSQYEINLWFDEEDIRFLSIEKLDTKKSMHSTLETTSGGDSSEKLSSNGSVSSLPPFTLPNRVCETSSFSGSSLGSQKDVKPTFPANVKKNKHTIQGTVELCTFMIDQFTKIKEKIEPATESLPKDEPTTPKVKGRESLKKNLTKDKSVSPQELENETPTKKVDKRTLKRALNKTQSDDEDEIKPKSAKQVKTMQSKTPVTPSKSADSIESSVIGYCVLAKWIDKKYYAGKVIDAKIGNKFVILFEDGATKILPKESIVFGHEDVLPLKDQKVYALVDDDYERGLVKSFAKIDDKVIYTVDADGKDVNVSASDIYLTDQQAKAIQNFKDDHTTPSTSAKTSDTPTEKSPTTGSRSTRNKRQATSPITPEAGFSGGVTKRGRRQKRVTVQQTRISESSDISDSPDVVAPPSSPESALEAIEGVQPELQKTPKESEISRMMIISDYMKQEPLCDVMQLLGPLPVSKTLFKTKHFLLTCTVGQKFLPANSCTNNSPQFSTLPLIKEHLRKQIENGGGTVYNHFEDIPKTKYKQCKLIASRPCTTAKYVQCLAADIQAISHEWIIESCKQNSLIDVKNFVLPSGWSIMNGMFVKWVVGKSIENRQNKKPLQKEIVLIASEHKDFVTFWSRVCKLAGATLRYIKSLRDVTPTTTGYMVTEQDFPQMIKSKAEYYGIPIVSTVWIVESLVLGKVCDPHFNGNIAQIYQDD